MSYFCGYYACYIRQTLYDLWHWDDKFISIGKGQSQNEAEYFIEISKQEIKKIKHMEYLGYEMHLEYDKVDIIFNKADAKMYKDKQRYKNITIKS